MGVISGALGLVGGVTNFFNGRSQAKKAQNYIDQFRWQDLQNPYKNLQVSTLGADFQREQANIAQATAVNALQGAGTRGLVGGLGRLVSGANDLNRSIAAGLDQQQKQIDQMAAQDETQIRAMQEKRQADELQGYGRMLGQGQQMQQQGMADIINAAGSIGQGIQGLGGDSGQIQSQSLPRMKNLPNVGQTELQSYQAIPTGNMFYNTGQAPYLSGGMTFGMGNNSYLNQ